MSNSKNFKIRVGGSVESMLQRAAAAMKAIEAGDEPVGSYGAGFQTMAEVTSMFTTKRWELLEVLKLEGQQSIYALAKLLGRNYSNVHTDVKKLLEIGIIQKTADEKIYVPWDEIDVEWPLPAGKAA